jgi:5-methylcytosine-specific restriction enzyme A
VPVRPPLHRAPTWLDPAERRKEFDRRRGSSHRRGYTEAWRKARAVYLGAHPLCVFCERDGLLTVATVVDHIEPHDGDYEKFWSQDNWQALCSQHHNSAKQRQDRQRARGRAPSKVQAFFFPNRLGRQISVRAKFKRGVK